MGTATTFAALLDDDRSRTRADPSHGRHERGPVGLGKWRARSQKEVNIG